MMLGERLKIYSLPITGEYREERRIVEARGELAQIGGGRASQYLVYWDIQPLAGAFRGQHYHLKKEESMYILRGSMQALFEDIDTQERQKHILGEGTRLIILPRLAHKFIPLEFVQVIEFSPQPFDKTDAYPYPL
jgi:hypothetical protein